MIIKKCLYKCEKCRKFQIFEVDKPFSTRYPNCNSEMVFRRVFDCDTEEVERIKNEPMYNPCRDPKSPYYVPQITCPTCASTRVKKIGSTERILSVSFLGLSSNKINKSFECKSCGYTW